jgi:hypothetical protein
MALRGLRVGAQAGLFAIITFVLNKYVDKYLAEQAIEDGMKRVDEESSALLALRFEEGLALAISKPTATIHANVTFKVARFTGPGSEGKTSPPLISKADVHVYFDTEPREGELASGEHEYFWGLGGTMQWTQVGASIPLDELLKQAPEDVRAAFAAEHRLALEAHWAEQPREAPAGYGVAPREDPIRR